MSCSMLVADTGWASAYRLRLSGSRLVVVGTLLAVMLALRRLRRLLSAGPAAGRHPPHGKRCA